MANRRIGYGYTNSQGIAKLDHIYVDGGDPIPVDHSYTGQGVGHMDIFAISSGVRSDTFDLLDCIWYLTNSFNLSKSSSVTATSNTNSVTFSTSSSTGTFFFATTNTPALTHNNAMEVKVVNYSGTVSVRFDDTTLEQPSRSKSISSTELNIQAGDTLRVEDDGTRIYFYKNGELLDYNQAIGGNIRFGFALGTNSSLELTEMKVYPI